MVHSDLITKLIFLDVDGVLNASKTWQGPHADSLNTLDPAMCDVLGHIVKETGATVVLSSTWRLHPHSLPKLHKWLEERGVHIHSHTRDLCSEHGHRNTRGHEIQRWVDDHTHLLSEDVRLVILDDDSDFNEDQLPFHVKTDFMGDGLTAQHAEWAISILNP